MKEAIAQQIAQLETARKHVLKDASHYTAIIPGILPIVGPVAALEIQRWGTEFLAESFASPALSTHAKEALSVQVLDTLKGYLEAQLDDEYVVKNVIMTAASIYGLIFRHITNNPLNAQIWATMVAIKSNILRRFDTGPIGVRICCIKFVQRIVLVQTPGVITDPRRPEQNEISLALVPREHPVIPPPNLEAEASGLLDRLLGVFYEAKADAILVDATLNCLSLLVKSRQSISNKIVQAVLNFNPFKQAQASTTREKVLLKSMEKTVRAFLTNVSRRQENGPHSARIRQHLERLDAAKLELAEGTSKKRGPPEPTDGLDNAKRAKLVGQAPVLPSGPVSIAQFFTLTQEDALRSFDVSLLPIDLVTKINMSVFQRADALQLDNAINALRARYLERLHQPPLSVQSKAVPAVSTEDQYEPEFDPLQGAEDEEQRENYTPPPPEILQVDEPVVIKAFKLPPPQPLTPEETQVWGNYSIKRVFDLVIGTNELSKQPKAGLNRLAGTSRDKETWMTIMIRLATRAQPMNDFDSSQDDKTVLQQTNDQMPFADRIRESLWRYIVEDFRHKIDFAISWLNEEWYNEKLRLQRASGSRTNGMSTAPDSLPTYEKWTLKLLDAIVPYLDANDKILIRFLGEIPEVSQSVLNRVKNMARDPDRVTLAAKAIYYLIMFKPPAKEMAIDALEDLWNNYEEAKASVKPILARVRPSAIATQMNPVAVVKKEEPATPGPPSASPAPVAAAG